MSQNQNGISRQFSRQFFSCELPPRSIAEATGIDKIREEERLRMAGNADDGENIEEEKEKTEERGKEEKGGDIVERQNGDGDAIRKLRKLGRHNLHVKYDRQYSTSF